MTTQTYFKDLDEKLLIGGLRPSSLVVVGGRPGMGKTAFLLSCAGNLTERGINFLYSSLEDKEERVLRKLISNLSEVEISKDVKEFTPIEFQRYVEAADKFKMSGSLLSTERNFDLFREEVLSLDESVKVVFIDFMQLFLYQPGYEETSKLITKLKNLCHEKDICIVVASQLSRNVEARQGHRPMLSDLRDSGVIEETADTVLFLLRREYYDPMDKPGVAEVVVSKNRHGDVGSINLMFRQEIMRFDNYKPFADPYTFSMAEREFSAFSVD